MTAAPSASSAQEDARPRTTQERVYSTEQAERGKQAYLRVCAACHPPDLYKGDTMVPWEGGSLSDLFGVISTLMPPENPGSLKPKEYADIVAYLLSINDMPAGTEELPAKTAVLKQIKWRAKP